MIIDNSILDELTAKAKENSRLRCNLDLRNSAEDKKSENAQCFGARECAADSQS